ncbi:MAG: permease [Firmicutes bacterium]|nr:permease [Bacillota bacterium]
MWELFADFLIDFTKVFALVIVLLFVVSYLQTFIPFRKFIEKAFKSDNILSLLFAIGLGLLSPFCSCTIIPVVIVLIKADIPLSLIFTFFTSAALLNIISLVSLFAYMPAEFVLIYIIFALFLCLVVYLVFRGFKTTQKKILQIPTIESENKTSTKSKLLYAWERTLDVLKDIWIYLALALIISFTITQVISEDVLSSALSENKYLTNIVLIALGGVLHGEIIALVPVLQLFNTLNVSFYIITAFLGTAAAVSIPLSIALSKSIEVKKIILYNLTILSFYLVFSNLALLIL